MAFIPSAHWVLELGGFIVGGVLYRRPGNAVHSLQPQDRWVRIGILAGAALGAAIGARGLYMAQYWNALQPQPLGVWFGGKTIVGALLGGLIGVESAKQLLRWQSSTGDAFVVPLLAAMILGRLGCQLAGLEDLTYGNLTDLPWGWDYGDGSSRHPTSLYEIAGLLLLGWVVARPVFQRRPGDRFRAFLAGYLALRLALDFLKPPYGAAAPGFLAPETAMGLTPIQWACIAGLACYASDLHRWHTHQGSRA